METWCGPTVTLGDVENTSIAAIWLSIYRHLDWKDVIAGRSVCKTFQKELPLLITQLRLRAFASPAQRRLQLRTVAATFANLRSLELVRPTSIAAEAAPDLLNWRTLQFPALQHLQVHVDVAGTVCLVDATLPALETLLLVSDVRKAGVCKSAITCPATGCVWASRAHQPVSADSDEAEVYRLRLYSWRDHVPGGIHCTLLSRRGVTVDIVVPNTHCPHAGAGV